MHLNTADEHRRRVQEANAGDKFVKLTKHQSEHVCPASSSFAVLRVAAVQVANFLPQKLSYLKMLFQDVLKMVFSINMNFLL